MMLTEKQIAFFKIFGFLKLGGLFADDVHEISDQFDEVFRQYADEVVDWVHATHENRLRRVLPAATQKNAYLASLLDDARVQGIATALLGSAYQFRGSDVSIYDCGTIIHQDADASNPIGRSIKMALYLDEVDESTGAIRLLPGSHHRGDQYFSLLCKNWLGPDVLGLATDEYPAVVLPSSPGDLLLWDYRVMHGTAYGGNQRRMLALEFSEGEVVESRSSGVAA
jgi:hypothetical protein